MAKISKRKAARKVKDGLVLKTSLTPEQLAKELGGRIEFTTGEAAKRHVLFLPRVEIDEVYKRRYDDLCARLDEINAHVKAGNITPEAERAVVWCIRWTMDQMELMKAEQSKLVQWLMEANEEVSKYQAAERGSRGGAAAAATVNEVKEFAIQLAKDLAPEGGWPSAPLAAEAVLSDVKEFARVRGRSFSSRIVAEWLRDAGIKRAERTP